MKKSTITQAARYARFSTEEQGEGAFSTLAAQDEATARYVAEQGWGDAGLYTDEGRTGTNLARPGWRRLLEDAKGAAFEIVVVTFMSRLGRGETFTIARHELARHGVQVVTARETFAEGVAGYAHRQMQQMMDGMYPVMVAEWTRAKMLEMLRQGYHCAGKAPYGYVATPEQVGKTSPKRLRPDPEAAPVVAALFAAAGEGGTAAALELWRTLGREAHPSAVRFLLKNRIYLGEARWGAALNLTAHEPLVTPEAFERAQRAIAERRYAPARRNPTGIGEGDYLLAGRVFCTCGARMTPMWSRGKGGGIYRYYQCTSVGRRDGEGCELRRIPAPRLHEAAIGEILALSAHPWRLRRHLERSARLLGDVDSAERAETQAQIRVQGLTRQAQRLVETLSLAPEEISRPILVRLAELETARREAAEELHARRAERLRVRIAAPSAASLSAVLSRFSQLWQAADSAEKATIVRGFIRRADVRKDTVGIFLYPPEGAESILEGFSGEGLRKAEAKGRSASAGQTPTLTPLQIETPLKSDWVRRKAYHG